MLDIKELGVAIFLWVEIDINHTIYFVVPHTSTSQMCEKSFIKALNIGRSCEKVVNRPLK